MKSYVRKIDTYTPDPNEIILSVGMIVKNEENHLENCLSALKKLLDNVPSELIIVDTGSTDKTKEIALKYTDKVYDFQWCNDFAAARNYGLEKAKGKWFMFVDADEYLDEDCEEMIKFFHLPELMDTYNSASFTLVNYVHGKKKSVDQFYAPRLVKMNENVKFEGSIHESLPQPNPHGIFSTKFHHYGYAYATKEDREKKAERNLKPLYEEYKKNPKDIRILAHFCDALTGLDEHKNFDMIEKHHLEYYEVAKNNITNLYGPVVYIKLIPFYMRNEKYEEAIKYIDEYLENELLSKIVTVITVYSYAVMLYIAETDYQDYEKAYEYIKKYFEYFEKFRNNELETVILRGSCHRGISEADYEDMLLRASRCSYELKKYDESLNYIKKLDFDEMTILNLKSALGIIRDLIGRTKNYLQIAKIYESILMINNSDKTNLILYLMQQYYLEHLTEREDFMNAMIDSGVKGKYIELMKLVKDDEDGKDISDDIQAFIDSVDDWSDGYAVAIFLAMKYNADMTIPIKNMSHKLIRENLRVIYDGYYDFSEVASNYFDINNFSDDIKKLYFMVTALEFAAEGLVTLPYDKKGRLCDTFVCALSDYVLNIYNPELLNPDDIEVLPELHRFGYYMTLAFTAENEGNDIAYIRSLKEALRLCESMKDVVQYYLTEFEKKLK